MHIPLDDPATRAEPADRDSKASFAPLSGLFLPHDRPTADSA